MKMPDKLMWSRDENASEERFGSVYKRGFNQCYAEMNLEFDSLKQQLEIAKVLVKEVEQFMETNSRVKWSKWLDEAREFLGGEG